MSTANPIPFINLPLGSTATIVTMQYRQHGVDIPPAIAEVLLSAIMTDTVILKSPTATDIDREQVEHLAGIIGGSGSRGNGKYTGVAPGCGYVVLKVLDSMGNGDIEAIIRAVDWILKNQPHLGIRFLNISIGMMPHTKRR